MLCSQERHFTFTLLPYLGVYMGTGKLNGDPAIDQHIIQGGVEIIVVTFM